MPFSRIKAVYKAENHKTKLHLLKYIARRIIQGKIDTKFYKKNFWESISNYAEFLNRKDIFV